MVEYLIIGVLCLGIIVLIIVALQLQTKNKQKIEQMQLGHNNQLLWQGQYYQNEIGQSLKAMEEYKAQVKKNIEDSVVLGEVLLIKEFRRLFQKAGWEDFVVYHGLEYRKKDGNFRKIDFLIICKKGAFVIESKMWKGTTFVLQDTSLDMFHSARDKQLKEFGVGSSDKLRIVNAQPNSEKRGQVIMSCYSNPVAQAREYSVDLKEILELSTLPNIVVFHQSAGCDVQFNNEPLTQATIGLTTLLTDKELIQYLEGLPPVEIDVSAIAQKANRYPCKSIIHSNNYQEAPYCFM
ncbi:NERD domain-containing protein [Ruminococcaceae bacterium OttesenSCG-928-A16]|nr:NERD domain-containing protein [Ruminococcaceae bacterium OttesenSCG-928-A16]